MARNKEKDLKRLADAFYENLLFDDLCEYGYVGLDCKRPFGNSDVEGDILEIIKWKPKGNDGYEACYSSEQLEYARHLYIDELIPYLKRQWCISNEK